MKTDQLITMLATGADVVESRAWLIRPAFAVVAGLLAATVLMVVFLGVRTDLNEAMQSPMFWVKQVFPLVLSVAAFVATTRLARPGVALGRTLLCLVVPVVAIWMMATVQLLGAAPEVRSGLVFGSTWVECIVSVSLLALPAFIALLTALRMLAPTQPVLAGSMAGLLSGAIAASAYSVHCPEMNAPFIGIWYLLGMLVPGGLGALAGSRLLRW